jgi:hypothetical protein
MLVTLIVELFCHDPSKNVPFTQVKSLIRHVKCFLSYFKALEGDTNDEDPNIRNDLDDM